MIRTTSRNRLTMFFIVVMFLSTFLTTVASAQRIRRHGRLRSQPATQTARPVQETAERESVRSKYVSTQKISPEEAAKQLAELCASLKNDYKPLTDENVRQSKRELLKATDDLIRVLKSDPNSKSAPARIESFHLQKLRDALANEDTAVQAAATETWKALHADEDARWSMFDGLRIALRRYFRFEALVTPAKADDKDKDDEGGKKTAYDAEFTRICDTLPSTIESYSKNVIQRQDAELAYTMDWLEDIAAVEPRAGRLAELARFAFSGVNLHIQVGSEFIGAGFKREIAEEKMEISENILGTRVTGSGTMSATSSGGPVEAKDHAEILVKVDAKMDSVTTGRQHPVTLNTKTTGTLHGEKRIIIAEDRISTTRAKTRADLRSNVYNVRVNAGPLVQGIARSQIQERQGASKAESRRRAEARMNSRIDGQIDQRVADLDSRYREQLREPLLKAGLFPRIWELSSTAWAIQWNALIASASQPSAMNPAPALAEAVGKDGNHEYGVLVRVHQSALNNAAALALAGKYFDEDEVVKKLQEQFNVQADAKPAALDRPEGEDPLRVTFAPEGPVRVSFNDNKITVLVQIHEFFLPRPGDDNADNGKAPALQARRGLNITLTYDIKIEKIKGDDGVTREVVVLEQAGEPKLSPRAGDGKQFSALSNPTQTVVKRRLKAMETRIVGKPRELEGEWKGKGVLVPTFASADDGWLIFGWDWVPAE